jgi:hypothetical protein
MNEAIQSSALEQFLKNANYDEGLVGEFVLPDPLRCDDGTLVTDSQMWQSKRRPEIINHFQSEIYGVTPQIKSPISIETLVVDEHALGGKATRKEIAIYLLGDTTGPRLVLQIFTPNNATKPVPAFLGCNFFGNHAITSDPTITLNSGWMRNTPDSRNVIDNKATESSRGSESDRWQVEMIIDSGFALATFYYGDLEADHVDGWKSGIRSVLPASDDWGAVAAWALGLSKAMDYLENDAAIDSKKVAVIGHSRLGKAALWAGALDERFALVVSNNSGAAGAALARRNYGESIAAITTLFPYWFCKKFASYGSEPKNLPVDMHQLIALIAPRPVYIASAEDDKWADPKGEFLSGKYAEPVYSLFNKVGINSDAWPDVHTPVGDFIGYHMRTGKHGVTAYDWQQYLNFATRHFRNS